MLGDGASRRFRGGKDVYRFCLPRRFFDLFDILPDSFGEVCQISFDQIIVGSRRQSVYSVGLQRVAGINKNRRARRVFAQTAPQFLTVAVGKSGIEQIQIEMFQQRQSPRFGDGFGRHDFNALKFAHYTDHQTTVYIVFGV